MLRGKKSKLKSSNQKQTNPPSKTRSRKRTVAITACKALFYSALVFAVHIVYRQLPSRAVDNSAVYKQINSNLKLADQDWKPTLRRSQDGKYTYQFKTHRGEPAPTPSEIRELIESPEIFEQESQATQELVKALGKVGVRIKIKESDDATQALWQPYYRTIEISPYLLKQGTKLFYETLNHEAIHVAQSCKGGSISSDPVLLGISRIVDPRRHYSINTTLFKSYGYEEKQIELEAYANAHVVGFGALLVGLYC